MGMAIVMRITMMLITTMSSTRVKPLDPPSLPLMNFLRDRVGRSMLLIFRIRCSIRRLLIRLAVNIENILASPALRLRIVLIAAQAPLVSSGERIARDAPQELHDLAIRPRQLHALHENFHGFGIAIGPDLRGSEVT